MLALLSLLVLTSTWAQASELIDAGTVTAAGRPVALVVVSPGVSPAAYDPLVDSLEQARLDAWLLVSPLADQDPVQIIETDIPKAITQLSAPGLALIGHGLGGTLAAMAAVRSSPGPDALVLLGAPLRFIPVELTQWLTTHPIPSEGLSSEQLTTARWRDHLVLELLTGTPPLPVTALSASWLGSLASWVQTGHQVSLQELDIPVWAAASGLDNLAPPESVRSQLPPGSFVRFGYHRLDPREYDHAALLSESRPLKVLTSWTAQTLRQQASPPEPAPETEPADPE